MGPTQYNEEDASEILTTIWCPLISCAQDTLSVNVEFGGQNWPNIKQALQQFSGIFLFFLWHFYGLKMAVFTKKNIKN